MAIELTGINSGNSLRGAVPQGPVAGQSWAQFGEHLPGAPWCSEP